MEWFWNNRETSRSNSNQLEFLTNSAHLLFLCAHLGLQHGIGVGLLIWFMDIYLLSRQTDDNIDWAQIAQQAKIFCWSAAAYYVLMATCEYFIVDIPKWVLSELNAQMIPQEEKLVLAKINIGQNSLVSGLIRLMEFAPHI